MKLILIIFSSVLSVVASAQTYFTFLEHNNASASVASNGHLLYHSLLGNGYEIPAGSSIESIFDLSMWMIGKDSTGDIFGTAASYSESDLFPGPIADDYSAISYTDEYLTGLYFMSTELIYTHIANYDQLGYITPSAIMNWPANGNISNGIASQLAPYEDLNGNQIYEPELGEYPIIRGDEAVYVIMNDENGNHGSGTEAIGVEVHAMLYQYTSSNHINNTTFINIQIFNRREKELSEFIFGLFTDFDLGNSADDFMGSDSARNMLYVYNGDSNDELGFSTNSYGINPPALGLVCLSENMESARAFSYSGIQAPPTSPSQAYWCLQGRFINSQAVVNDGLSGITPNGYVTGFQYSGNPNGAGWSEQSAGSLPAERAGLLSSKPKNFLPGEKQCYDYAVIFSDLDTTHLVQAENLGLVADYVQAYYDYESFACDGIVLKLDNKNADVKISIFPNPTSNMIQIQVPDEISKSTATLEVHNAFGQLIYSNEITGQQLITLDMQFYENGIYFMTISANEKVYQQKIVKQ